MPHSTDAPARPSNFDPYSFRKYMNKTGAAYRNQAVGLIRISLTFSKAAEQSFGQDAELSGVLKVCDEALLKAATLSTDKHHTLKHHFDRAIRMWEDYDMKFHQSKHIDAVKELMKDGKEKDGKEKDGKKPRKFKRYDDPLLKVIAFRIMRDLSEPQPTIVRQELHDDTKQEEVLWNFIRIEDEKKRLTLSQNPHFYGDLPISPVASAGKFRTKAILENWHAHHSEPICVLTNTLGRVFLELDRPPRAFDNVLDMNGSFIFKSTCGELWSEGILKASILQGDLHSSFHVEPLHSHPGIAATVNPPNSGTSPTISSPCVPAKDLNDALRQAFNAPNIKILIKRCSGCTKAPVVAYTLNNAVSRNLNNEGFISRARSSIFLALFFIVVWLFL